MPEGRGYADRRDGQGQPGRKRQRLDSRVSGGSGGANYTFNQEGNMRSGNGNGIEERSRRSVPVNYQRPPQREPTLRMRMEAGRRSLDRSLGESSEGARRRNWSPIRSPENLDRSRPRDRDLREEVLERRNQRGRGLSQVFQIRGRGNRRGGLGQNNNPEEKEYQGPSGRRYQNQHRQ